MAKKEKNPKKEPEPEPVAEEVEQPEEVLPPAEYPPPPEDPARVHPATIGYEQCGYGTVTWDTSKISTVCLGSVWQRSSPKVYTDPRVVHPATAGFAVDLAPGKALDAGAVDMAMVNPIFLGDALSPRAEPQQPPGTRGLLPQASASDQGKYLDEQVWPTLEPALEKILLAIKYYVPTEVADTYPGGRGGPAVQRVQKPWHADGFDPLEWLATYLRRYNPNVPPRFTPWTAAVRIQATYRGYMARMRVRRLKATAQAAMEAEAQAQLEWRSAITIQAAWRGHCVRLRLAMGRLDEFVPGRSIVA